MYDVQYKCYYYIMFKKHYFRIIMLNIEQMLHKS